jgi:hypothetical protein
LIHRRSNPKRALEKAICQRTKKTKDEKNLGSRNLGLDKARFIAVLFSNPIFIKNLQLWIKKQCGTAASIF